ncbi:MAG: DNA polymerase III subunit gamma/tau [Candidatus Yanofskybacteria bacterium]|nr:DNA polymerase III subunit gamma/tau [Candidatus Yanofskybacteria bacterium]
MLYRTYRPQSFSQIVGQQHVVKTLKGALTSGRLGHAYLFTGPRGTGKTTIARVFAKALNCLHPKNGEPDNTCERCMAVNESRSMNLIEIDGASHGRVDEMRALQEGAVVAASSGGYKVFLIDEVHMVSQGGFNALLKILEEPPSHVIFILATTDPHKIPATVLSRVQRFDFRKLTAGEIASKLKEIAQAEKANVDDDAILAIAHASDGAMRDAEVALTKLLTSFGKNEAITAERANEILGLIPRVYHSEFLGYLTGSDRMQALSFIQNLYDSGINLEHFTKDFLEYVRKVLVAKLNPASLTSNGNGIADSESQRMQQYAQTIETQQLIKMLTSFSSARNEMRYSPIPQLPLELAVLDLTHA